MSIGTPRFLVGDKVDLRLVKVGPAEWKPGASFSHYNMRGNAVIEWHDADTGTGKVEVVDDLARLRRAVEG